MVNTNKANEVKKASLSDGELLALVSAAGVKPAKLSPLAQIKGSPASTNNLQSSGLIDKAGRPAPACVEALAILANPASEIDLLWGNSSSISLSKAYSGGGQDKFVSFTGADGRNNISFFLSSSDITGLMAQKLVFAEIKEPAALNLEVSPAAAPVFFALLDTYRESQLKAALERRQETTVTASLEDLNRIIQEAKLETDYSWYSPSAYNALPLGFEITESRVNEGFSALKKEGVIGAEGEFTSGLTSFAYRAFPLVGFFGIKILSSNGGSLEKTQLALFRGPSSLLLVQLTGESNVQISSIGTSELPELLFNFGTRATEAPAPTPQPAAAAATVICGKCSTQNPVSAKFCAKCGAPLSAPKAGPKFCPKCGDPVTANEKFCDKCGTKLK